MDKLGVLPYFLRVLAPQVVRNATQHWDEQTTRLFAAQAIDAFRAVAGEDLLHGVLDEEHLALLRTHLEGRIAGLEGEKKEEAAAPESPGAAGPEEVTAFLSLLAGLD